MGDGVEPAFAGEPIGVVSGFTIGDIPGLAGVLIEGAAVGSVGVAFMGFLSD